MKILVPIIALLIMVSSCAAPETDIANIFSYKFYLIKPPTGTLSFEDEDLQFTFTPESDNIKILFVNKSARHAIINWEKAIYVDKDGASHRLITKKVDYKDKDKTQIPTSIAPGSQTIEWVTPADHIYRTLFVWNVRPMFPKLTNAEIIDSWDRATFNVILPIEVNGEPRDYRFEFKVKTR
ncbi:MAG: hypothetical protein ACE5KK_04150 [Candidatus Brocadiales bacterium]